MKGRDELFASEIGTTEPEDRERRKRLHTKFSKISRNPMTVCTVTTPQARAHAETVTADFDMEACIARARRRDEEAFRELMRELYPLVLKIVRAHLPQRTGEEDLCQMIFIKAFANLDQYSGKAPVQHWVSRIAVNTCLNALHAEKARPELRWSDLNDLEAETLQNLAAKEIQTTPIEDMASREIVDKLLAALPPQDRLVINLMYIEGCSLSEVRQVTGWNIAVVKVRAFRARQKLRGLFAKLTKEETL